MGASDQSSSGKRVDDDDDDYGYHASTSSSSNNRQLSRPVQQHLTRVYGTLASVSASSALGSYAYMRDYVPFDPSILSFVGFVLLLGIIFTRNPQPSTSTQMMRLGALNLFGLFQGIRIGPLVDSLFDLNPTIVPQGLFMTLLVFLCFSISALTAERRSWIYMGGILFSAISLLMWIGLFNVFLGSSMLYSAELYLGLLAFAGFVAYDTQMIVERADLGDQDYVSHGADLFVDLFGLLVRILVILGRKEEGESQRRKKRRD